MAQTPRPAADGDPRAIIEDACRQADHAAAASSARVRVLHELDELRGVVALFNQVWGATDEPVLGLEHLRALAHAGNYVVGAHDLASDALLGATVGFFAAPPGHVLHSDITGVVGDARHRGLGRSLKLHQRAWALSLGLDQITWTFDPLVARNAHFNLAKLRARGTAYLVDFYGAMADGLNEGQGSDRLLMSWSLASDEVVAACAGLPSATSAPDSPPPPLLVREAGRPMARPVAAADAPLARVEIPDDIEGLRRTDSGMALAWRIAVRETLGAELAAGGTLVGFDRSAGYLVERASR